LVNRLQFAKLQIKFWQQKEASMQGRRYAIYDVFTSQALAGNQLAVVFDCEGLDTARMQAIAREFNLSETTFILPPVDGAHEARVRIFVPVRELPFAGHPTVGSAVAIAELRHGVGKQAFMLEEQVGNIPCRVEVSENGGRAEFDLPRLPEQVDFELAPDLVATALGLSPVDIGFEDHLISVWTAGVPYVSVPVRRIEAVRNVRIDEAAWLDLVRLPGAIVAAPYIYCHAGDLAGSNFHARMLAPWDGIKEDPATGSAAAALAGALSRFETLPQGETRYVIEQGVEMGRPSCIEVTLLMDAGILSKVSIGGHAVKVADGHLFA
jgi:trans-2,3-dihydro-3-hydroxyanthranilate isomerase